MFCKKRDFASACSHTARVQAACCFQKAISPWGICKGQEPRLPPTLPGPPSAPTGFPQTQSPCQGMMPGRMGRGIISPPQRKTL